MKSIQKNKLLTAVLPIILSLALVSGCTANSTSAAALSGITSTADEQTANAVSFVSSEAKFDSDDEDASWSVEKAKAMEPCWHNVCPDTDNGTAIFMLYNVYIL